MTAENPINNTEFPTDLPIPLRSWKQRLAALCIILLILAVGVGVAVMLMKTKPVAKKKSPQKMQILVDTETVEPSSSRVKIEGYGRMVPARQITLQARVAGTVQYLHPQFTPGGIIRQGEVLVRLDDTDYRLELKRKQNVLQQALADLRLEQGNQSVASQEWEQIKRQIGNIDTTSVDLALRKPHLEKVQANVASARTDVERVEVDLERTVIKAPFNAVVKDKHIDLGSQVGSQSQLATLVGTDTFWAEVTIPEDKLAWFTLPDMDKAGSPAQIFANHDAPRTGRVIKVLPDVEEQGLMARLLVEVDAPMAASRERKPLLLGSFVRVEIEGKMLNNVVRVPRMALKDDQAVLLATPQRTLHIQPVSVLWKNSDHAYIADGLKAGDRIIISRVAAPVEGMPLILNGVDNETSEGQKAPRGNEHDQR